MVSPDIMRAYSTNAVHTCSAKLWHTVAFIAVLGCVVGCGKATERPQRTQAPRPGQATAKSRLRLATTTSTENSGLLYELLSPFELRCNCKVDVIAVGTGKALKLGENGDVDLVLVHAREAEDEFVARGFGINRREVMHNDFVILGPQEDPAAIGRIEDVAAAVKRIAERGARFCSRGDESGTHKKEKLLWQAAGVSPKGPWYVETGQGMGATLIIANEKLAYVLTDRGTYLAYRDKIQLAILCERDERLLNPYGIIAVSPKRHPHVQYDLAMKLIEYVTSPRGQKIIGNFKKAGEQLFHPNAEAGK